jgi:mRNA-degrading endonuclease RelE of RelBE toxin-antitoxin system
VSYKIFVTPTFKKQAKRLAKKFRSLNDDLDTFASSIKDDPTIGIHLGDNVYKVRLKVKSKGKGKSGGMRIILYVKVTAKHVYLLSIFDKSEQATITSAEIRSVLREINP